MIIQTQTASERGVAYQEFLGQMVAQGLQPLTDDVHNYTSITTWIEAAGLSVNYDSMVKAVNAIGSPQLHWQPSMAEQERQRQAVLAQKNHAAEVDRILDGFCAEHPDFLKDDHNLALLVKFCKEQHHGVLGDVQIRHFWRVYQNSPDLHRLASNTQVESADAMWLRQNLKQESPEQQRLAREEAAAEKAKRFKDTILNSKARATFEGELRAIRGYRDMSPLGVSWAKTFSYQKEKMSGLLSKYPQYAAEIQQAISKVGK